VTAVTKGNNQFFIADAPQDARGADKKYNNINIGYNVPLISGVWSVQHKRGVSSSLVLEQPETTGA